MGRLHELHDLHGQSPWLDDLERGRLASGAIARWVERGVRGITSNPSIFAASIAGGEGYDEQLADLAAGGATIEELYWELVVADIAEALRVLRPVHDASDGVDGKVSVEVSPALARDTAGTLAEARTLFDRLAGPNLMVKVPGTAEGLPAVRELVAELHSINVTLIFGLERYREVMEAYVAGLEDAVAAGADDLSSVSSVASFFISRVDTEVDRRLESIGTEEALALRGRAAVTQGRLAYAAAAEVFSGPRWEALAARGARPQRPLWASTSTKNPAYPDTLYVDALIGPGTVNTLPTATLEAFDDHGTLDRTVDADPDGDRATWARLGDLVDLADVGRVLEEEGVAAFAKSFDEVLAVLDQRAAAHRPGPPGEPAP